MVSCLSWLHQLISMSTEHGGRTRNCMTFETPPECKINLLTQLASSHRVFHFFAVSLCTLKDLLSSTEHDKQSNVSDFHNLSVYVRANIADRYTKFPPQNTLYTNHAVSHLLHLDWKLKPTSGARYDRDQICRRHTKIC